MVGSLKLNDNGYTKATKTNWEGCFNDTGRERDREGWSTEEALTTSERSVGIPGAAMIWSRGSPKLTGVTTTS
jgi:hypothetical protein